MYKGVGPPLRLVVYTLIHNDHSAMRGKKRLYTETSPFQFRDPGRVQCQEKLWIPRRLILFALGNTKLNLVDVEYM